MAVFIVVSMMELAKGMLSRRNYVNTFNEREKQLDSKMCVNTAPTSKRCLLLPGACLPLAALKPDPSAGDDDFEKMNGFFGYLSMVQAEKQLRCQY
jgi:hypothetical protein